MRYQEPAFTVPGDKVLRVIIDTDAANEADDQYAIVQALLSPRLDIRAIIAAHFGNEKSPHSMEDSYQEILRLTGMMNRQRDVFHMPVLRGAPQPLEGETAIECEGARAIVREALRDAEEPLYVISLGALTNVASALLMEPAIAQRMTVIWIGGNVYPQGGWEYNLKNDVTAARYVFQSDVPLWQVPRNVYQMMLVSVAELAVQVRPCGEIGAYLFSHLVEWGHTYWGKRSPLRTGECWFLGDSPAVGLLLNEHEFHYHTVRAPFIRDDMTYDLKTDNREIRIYDSVDSRFILQDLYAKLKLFTQMAP